KIRQDDFGGSNKESVGSSLGKVLKEEFYRTMILVCGKRTLWWIMPPGVSDQEYLELKKIWKRRWIRHRKNLLILATLARLHMMNILGRHSGN
ncbi:MAG: hypothetical protein ACE5FU_06935, partial [Nitrospinota bacterium]